MPSFYIHMSVADHVASLLSELDEWPIGIGTFGSNHVAGPDPKRLAGIAQTHSNYYALGAIGPDLFFLLPDFRSIAGVKAGNTLVGVADFVNDLMTWVDEWILDWWEPTFGPFAQNLEEAVSRLTGDMSTQVGNVLGALSSLTVRAAMTLGSVTNDWFGLFSLGHNEGFDNRDFLWSDMLHYRKTSQFGQVLWQIADRWESRADPNDPAAIENARLWTDRLRAYALGYISHIATDVTGHPFTNEKSGGPFRTHWQRHKVVENHMDARVYDNEHGTDSDWSQLTGSALHYHVAFAQNGASVARPTLPAKKPTIRNLHERRRLLDLSSELPIEVATLLYEALGEAYVNSAVNDHPTKSSPKILAGDGRPTPDAIQDTYAFLFRYLRHVMLDGYWHEKPLPPELFPNLDFPLATDPADEAPNAADEDLDLLDLLLAVIRLCLFLVAVAIWILTLPVGILLDAATFGPRNAVYYGIELPIYYMTLALRRLLVMTGYLMPTKDEIEVNLTRLGVGPRDLFLATLEAMGDTLINLDDAELTALGAKAEQMARNLGRNPQDVLAELLAEVDLSQRPPDEPSPDQEFPRQHEDCEHFHPWRYPTKSAELASTTAGPYERGDDADLLIQRSMPGDASIRSLYEKSSDPDNTEAISRSQMTREVHLGDPIHFSAYLIWQLTRTEPLNEEISRMTDWNLDADRGYAWKCWDWNRFPKEAGLFFKDTEDNLVLWPCTPPSQFKKEHGAPMHDPAKPLLIHWADTEDPHCKEEL